MSGRAGTLDPVDVDGRGELLADPIAAELEKLGPAPEAEPVQDAEPIKKRRTRSGTSGAERARRAKAGGTGPAPAKPRPARSSSSRPNIASGMAQLYTMAGLGFGFVPSGPAVAGPLAGAGSITAAVGRELVAQSGNLGAVWEAAAKDDPRIREALEKLLAVSTFGQIIAAHVPVVLAGMVAAGALNPELLAAMGGQS